MLCQQLGYSIHHDIGTISLISLSAPWNMCRKGPWIIDTGAGLGKGEKCGNLQSVLLTTEKAVWQIASLKHRWCNANKEAPARLSIIITRPLIARQDHIWTLSVLLKQMPERCCKLGHQIRIFGGFPCVSTSLDRDLHRKKWPCWTWQWSKFWTWQWSKFWTWQWCTATHLRQFLSFQTIIWFLHFYKFLLDHTHSPLEQWFP